MTRKELEDLVFDGAGSGAVIYRLWYAGVDVSDMYTEDTLRTILHRCIDDSSWGKAVDIIYALDNSQDDSVFIVDDYKGKVLCLNEPSELYNYVLEEKLIELED